MPSVDNLFPESEFCFNGVDPIEVISSIGHHSILAATDADGVILEVNQHFCDLSQYDREELVGKTHKVVNSGYHSDEFWRNLWVTLKEGKTWTGTICNRAKNGSLYWVQSTVSPLRDQSGKIKYFLALRTDITKTRKESSEVEREQFLLEEASELAKVGAWEVNLKNNDVYWSDYVRRIHEVPENFVPTLEKGIEFYEEGWSRDTITKVFEEGIADGKGWDEELTIISYKGKKKWVRAKGLPIFENNELIGIRGIFQDIHEEKLASLENETKNAILQNLLDSSSEYSFIGTDLEGVITTFNKGAERLLGYSANEMVAKCTPVVFHLASEVIERGEVLSSSLGRCVEGFEVIVALAKTEDFERREWTYVHKSGQHIPVSLTVTAVRNNARDIIGYLGIAHNLTTEREMMKKVLESEGRFRGAFEKSGIGMAIVGLDGRWLEVNESICDIVGYEEKELLKLTFQDITHPEDLEKDLDLLRETLAGKRSSYKMVKRYYDKKGQTVWVNLTVSLVRNEKSEPLYFVSQIEDITARVLLENKLEDSQKRLELAASAGKIGIWDWEITVNQLIWDATMHELYGSELDTVETGVEKWQKGLHPDDSDRAMEEVQAALSDEKAFDTSFRIVKQNGEVRHLRAIAIVQRDSDGEPVRMVGSNWDITETIQKEEKLKKLAEKARQASIAKSQFLANMSHEIRTPMNGIIGMTSLLLDMNDITAEHRNYVEIIKSSSQSLMSLINDILDFSKVEAGKLELESLEFNLRDILDDFTSILAIKANTKNISFICHAENDVPDSLVGDPGRLRQILLNLAGNAIKFTDNGSVEVKVTIKERKGEKVKLLFKVIDTGIGIDDHAKTHIFDEFSQADSSTTRNYGGTGLGLTISRQLSQLMGGEIGVESETGKGSTFWFTVEFRENPRERSEDLKELSRSRILIIQPNKNIKGFIAHQFKIWSVDTVTCENASEAVEILNRSSKQRYFNYIILDDAIDSETIEDSLARNSLRLGVSSPRMILCAQLGETYEGNTLKERGFCSVIHKPIRQSELFNVFRGLIQSTHDGSEAVDELSPTRFVFRKRSVLVVEDNPVNQIVARGLLEKFGMRVNCASDGKEAIDLLQTMDFDMVFMDVQMPILDGLEATKRIRSEFPEPVCDIPVIALTAHARGEDEEICRDAGMNDYLTKPLIPNRLFSVLDRYLPNHELEEDGEIQNVAVGIKERLFDREAMINNLMGERGLAQTVAMQVVEQLESANYNWDDWKGSIGEFRDLREDLHGIKGMAANCFAKELCDFASKLEQLTQDKSLSSPPTERLIEFKDTIENTLNELRSFVDEK